VWQALRRSARNGRRRRRRSGLRGRKPNTRQSGRICCCRQTSVTPRARAGDEGLSKSSLGREIKAAKDELARTSNGAFARELKFEQQAAAREANEQDLERRTAEAVQKRKATKQHKKDIGVHYTYRGKLVGGTFTEYQDAVEYAQKLRAERKLTLSQAIKAAKEDKGIDVGKFAVRKGTLPNKRGRPSIFADEEEKKLVDIIVMLRSMKVDLGSDEVMHIANEMMQGTDYQNTWLHGRVTKRWYYAFLKRHEHKLGTGKADGIEFDRARWSTSDVVGKHYDVVEKLALELKLAMVNPEYDENVPYNPATASPEFRCQRILWMKKRNVYSCDETEVSNNMTWGCKSRKRTRKSWNHLFS
jgi:hypothetical protein